MHHHEPKKANRLKKLKLFRDLLSLHPDLKTGGKQIAQLMLIRSFYLIFGFENMVIDQNGLIYSVSGKEELISLLRAAANIHVEDKNHPASYRDFFNNVQGPVDDLDIYIKIFSRLKELGFDFRYEIQLPTDQGQNGVDLERADRMVDALKNFLAEGGSNGNFIDEHIMLNNIDLPKIQKKLREQMLYKKIEDLAPDKILVAYYKVYQKLPPS